MSPIPPPACTVQFYSWTKSLLGFPAFLEFMAVRDSSISVGCNGTALMVPSVNLCTAQKPLGRFHMENTQLNLDDVLNFFGSIMFHLQTLFRINLQEKRKGNPWQILYDWCVWHMFSTCWSWITFFQRRLFYQQSNSETCFTTKNFISRTCPDHSISSWAQLFWGKDSARRATLLHERLSSPSQLAASKIVSVFDVKWFHK